MTSRKATTDTRFQAIQYELIRIGDVMQTANKIAMIQFIPVEERDEWIREIKTEMEYADEQTYY